MVFGLTALAPFVLFNTSITEIVSWIAGYRLHTTRVKKHLAHALSKGTIHFAQDRNPSYPTCGLLLQNLLLVYFSWFFTVAEGSINNTPFSRCDSEWPSGLLKSSWSPAVVGGGPLPQAPCASSGCGSPAAFSGRFLGFPHDPGTEGEMPGSQGPGLRDPAPGLWPAHGQDCSFTLLRIIPTFVLSLVLNHLRNKKKSKVDRLS